MNQMVFVGVIWSHCFSQFLRANRSLWPLLQVWPMEMLLNVFWVSHQTNCNSTSILTPNSDVKVCWSTPAHHCSKAKTETSGGQKPRISGGVKSLFSLLRSYFRINLCKYKLYAFKYFCIYSQSWVQVYKVIQFHNSPHNLTYLKKSDIHSCDVCCY